MTEDEFRALAERVEALERGFGDARRAVEILRRVADEAESQDSPQRPRRLRAVK